MVDVDNSHLRAIERGTYLSYAKFGDSTVYLSYILICA